MDSEVLFLRFMLSFLFSFSLLDCIISITVSSGPLVLCCHFSSFVGLRNFKKILAILSFGYRFPISTFQAHISLLRFHICPLINTMFLFNFWYLFIIIDLQYFSKKANIWWVVSGTFFFSSCELEDTYFFLCLLTFDCVDNMFQQHLDFLCFFLNIVYVS